MLAKIRNLELHQTYTLPCHTHTLYAQKERERGEGESAKTTTTTTTERATTQQQYKSRSTRDETLSDTETVRQCLCLAKVHMFSFVFLPAIIEFRSCVKAAMCEHCFNNICILHFVSIRVQPSHKCFIYIRMYDSA